MPQIRIYPTTSCVKKGRFTLYPSMVSRKQLNFLSHLTCRIQPVANNRMSRLSPSFPKFAPVVQGLRGPSFREYLLHRCSANLHLKIEYKAKMIIHAWIPKCLELWTGVTGYPLVDYAVLVYNGHCATSVTASGKTDDIKVV